MEKYELWLAQKSLDAAVRAQLEDMRGNENEIYESFYKDLSFGTAGLRGILGAGTNRMNIYTVGRATQGFADYLISSAKNPSVAIAYDSRNNSELFAKYSAGVLAANGIRVYIYSELMPTPMLSFAVRHYKCNGGIVITASHNPAKYNGYKVYGSDGCQAGPEMADAILAQIEKTDIFNGIKSSEFKNNPLITIIPQQVENEFTSTVLGLRVQNRSDSNLKVVYTPLNGAGRKPVLEVLKRIGVGEVSIVKKQEMPDGNFTTCPYPNPEERKALAEGLELCEKVNPDILLATDPDCDRVGIAVRHGNEYILPSGNDVGVLLLDYICKMRKSNGTMPQNPVTVKTIVTTAMVDDIARFHGVRLESVLTGFKFIGGVIAALEKEGRGNDYIFGFEESYGYLLSGHVRDKDAVSASMLICDMASFYKEQGKTLVDVLNELYEQFGWYTNKTVSFAFEGAKGMEKMAQIMKNLRKDMPQRIAGADIVEVSDYLASTRTGNGATGKIDLPKSDVLGFKLSDGCTFLVRPSGTEPKLKVYIFAKADSRAASASRVEQLNVELSKIIME